MGKRTFRITQADFMLANRKAAREQEIREHGRQITFRSVTQKSKKVYDRNRLKRGRHLTDDLPFFVLLRNNGYFRYISAKLKLPMDTQLKDSIKRLLIRLEDTRREIQSLSYKVDYPKNAKFERAYDAIESAEKYLEEFVSE